jgi:hypothetical protein
MELLPQLRRGELTREELTVARTTGASITTGSDSTSPAKVKIVLDGERVVTVQAPELDLSGYIDAIRVMLRKAKRAQAHGLALAEFVRSTQAAKSKAKQGASRVSV